MSLPVSSDQQREAVLDGEALQQDWNSKFLTLVRNGVTLSGRDPAAQGPFGRSAELYRQSGWLGTLPVGERAKEKYKPPTGFTGRNATYPTDEQVTAWCSNGKAIVNIGLHLGPVEQDVPDGDPLEVLGLDVDDYVDSGKVKEGGQQLAELEAELGPLPPTVISGSREGVSGIRFYVVPPGLAWPGKAAKHIDVIQKAHRYAIVWPSIHPDGRQYRWRKQTLVNGQIAESYLKDGEIPDAGDLPSLPDAWVDYLTDGRVKARDADELDMGLSPGEMVDWAKVTLPDYAKRPCLTMRQAVKHWKRNVDEDPSSHPNITGAHWNLICLAVEGHRGLGTAQRRIDNYVARDTITKRVKRSPSELRSEFFRSYINALRKLKAETSARKGTPAKRELAAPCDCGLAEKALGPDGPWRSAEEAAKRFTVVKTEARAIFQIATLDDWTQPVPEPEWIVTNVLSANTFGPGGGPKKCLKTHDNASIAIAGGMGLNLYNDARFAVPQPRKVLYIVAEGGHKPIMRLMQRMCRAYDADPREVFEQVRLVSGAAPMDSNGFKDELKIHLDEWQPELVLLESFYNVHPTNVDTSNLYQRGGAIDSYHRMVRRECSEATSLLTDHFKKSMRVGQRPELDDISMSGQAENADSWIIRNHATPPDVENGEFRIFLECGSRQWGGRSWTIEWHLGRFDEETRCYDRDITWSVAEAITRGSQGSSKPSPDDNLRDLLQYVGDNPGQSKTTITETLTGKYGGKARWSAAFAAAETDKYIVSYDSTVARGHGRPQKIVAWKVSDDHKFHEFRVRLGAVEDGEE